MYVACCVLYVLCVLFGWFGLGLFLSSLSWPVCHMLYTCFPCTTHASCVPNKVAEESGEDEGLGESPAKRPRQDDAASSDEEEEGRDPGKQD